MTRLLQDKVCLITGATSGIGEAAAQRFARQGAKVVLAGRRAERGEALAADLRREGHRAMFVTADVSSEDDVEALVNATVEEHGRLDAAFNNAGIEGRFAPILETTAKDFDDLVAVNLRGAWLCLRAEARQMLAQGTGGAIVSTSSWLAVGGAAGTSLYSATKGGVDALSRAAAVELAARRVRVNTIQPGYVVTEMFRRFLDPDDRVAGRPFLTAAPARRYGQPDEVATLAAWLCSDEASYVAGQCIAVDGALTVPGHRPESPLA